VRASLGFGDLVLCAGTVPASGLAERVAAAAAAGFAGISLFPHDYRRARESGLSDADLRALLRDHEIAVAEIDPLLAWLPGADAGVGKAGRAFLETGEDGFYAIADAVGARSINAALADPRDVALGAIADGFSALCERAASTSCSSRSSSSPGRRSGCDGGRDRRAPGAPDGGVMLDAWHRLRSGAPIAAIDARACAASRSATPAAAEARYGRGDAAPAPPAGDGDAEVPALLRHLAAGGCTAPIGVEVFSDALAAEPLRESHALRGRGARVSRREVRETACSSASTTPRSRRPM
jgi:sugar phosphate isomerase/epimerase